MNSSTADTSNQKKDPFEQLTKEELVKKCKQFLTIAQKAKQAKDELTDENNSINNKLREIETTSQNNIQAMQEMINVLTQQKLELVTQNDILTKQNQDLSKKYENCEEELFNTTSKMQDLDTENQGFNRQVKRLSEENDQLISHLDVLEKRINELNEIGAQQREQLLVLEKQNKNEKQDINKKTFNTETHNTLQVEDMEELHIQCNKFQVELENAKFALLEKDKKLDNLYEEIDTLKLKNEQINQLKNYCQTKTNEIKTLQEKNLELTKIIEDLNLNLENKNGSIELLNSNTNNLQEELNKVNNLLLEVQNKYTLSCAELETTKKAKDYYNEKFKSYHLKLIKVFTDVKDLKHSKKTLLEIIENYSKYIEKWQNEIKRVSIQFVEEIKYRDSEIKSYTNENTDLKTKVKSLEEQVAQTKLNENDSSLLELQSEINVLAANLKLKEDSINSLAEENKKMLITVEENKSKDKEIDKIKSEYDKLITENRSLFDNIKVTEEKLALFQKDNINLVNRITDLQHKQKLNDNVKISNAEIENQKETINLINNTISNTVANIKSLEEKIDLLEKESKYYLERVNSDEETITTFKNENKILTEKCKELHEIIINYKKLENSLHEENEKICQSLKQTELQNSEYLKIINDIQNDLKLNYISNINFNDLSKTNNELVEKNEALNECIATYENEISSFKRDHSDLSNQIFASKRENTELLREMNDMNQALKERGETISKQQEYTQELIRKLQNLEQASQNFEQSKRKLEEEISLLKNKTLTTDFNTIVKEHDSILHEKNETIKSLEEEIKQLKESFNTSFGRDNQDGGYVDSENMSTSTISRSEDAARLRDLEGSWEERYTKLRTLALKLRGKVKELTEQLSLERAEKTEIQTKLSTVTRNLQTVHSECDKIQDQFENLNKENKQNIKQIELITNENDKIKQDLLESRDVASKLEYELDSLRKEKLGSNSAAKQFTTQIQNLKKEIDDNNNKIKDFVTKVSKLESHILSKEQELQTEIKNHNITKEKLQKLEKEFKKNSVLSLEMEDYERSLKDLSQKLEKKNELVLKLEDKCNSRETSIMSLKNQLKLAEEKFKNEEDRCLDLQKQLSESQTKISSAEAATAQKENRIREVLKTLEEYKISTEEEHSELVKSVTQSQKQIEQYKSERDHCKSIILGLEEKNKDLSNHNNVLQQELLHIRVEFSNYKVRAQSVLRQNQTRDIASEERLTDEVSELKSQVDLLTTELQNTTSEFKKLTVQYDAIEKEKNKIVLKNQDLEKLVLKEKDENNSLILRQQQLITEHREAMRAQKIHVDTLTQCYKQQLTEQEERHIKEITELKAAHVSNLHMVNKTHDETIDVTSMQREEGEGSESVGSNNQLCKTSILSLDKLLNADTENNLDYEAELSQYKKKFTEYETRVTHLTDLLADAEQDLAKHAQLNQHLKEEIRRHQRSVEREKHAENLEYLKNVVFKFLTLHSGDEKSHLVPVLNTILKLSPEETQKLNSVARGMDLNARGWGSYLPLWTGSNNQN